MAQRRSTPTPGICALWVVAVATSMGCAIDEQGVPEGKLAVVGETVLGPEDLASVGSQLGAYGRLRFSGAEGQATLLQALVTAELMAQEAKASRGEDDPRVLFALEEEIASVHLSAELERLVPTATVAADREGLRAYYTAHPGEFTDPQRRSVQGVVFATFDEAEAALVKLLAGEAELSDYGEVFATPLQARDEGEFPAFHRHLFADGVGLGDFMPVPVFVGQSLLVGRVQKIEGPTLQPAAAPEVHEALVQAVRGPQVAAAKDALLQALEERLPTRASAG